MTNIKPSEVSEILKQQLEGVKTAIDIEEVGTVLQVGDGIARIYGLSNVRANELIEFVEGVDQEGQVDQTEAGAEVGGGHRTDRHTLNGAHFELVQHFHLAAQHRKRPVIYIDLAFSALPELVPDGKPGVDALETGRGNIGDDHLILGAGGVEGRLPGI